MANSAGISQSDFEFISKIVRDNSAIVLEAGKEYLVESRLSPLLNSEKLGSYEELVKKMRNDVSRTLVGKVVEAMTTNETSFFRDIHPFEVLKSAIIPELIQKREATRELNIWCGASSSGQEPFSIAMMLKENFPKLNNWKLYFMASDISKEMQTRCKQGIFSQLEINRGLPAALMVKYFQRNGTSWQIKPEIQNMVDFQIMNLSGSWPMIPKLDLVMMRNVLIYFDVPTKKLILGKVRNLLKPDGYLFLGAAETTLNLDENFERMNFKQSGCYRLKQG
ncbi:MAG: protein-glutamate O-methyltransferase CheR [Candidatus Nitrohelix vancouverensis]|uniref:protein-glutamate O-methyltransferase n=1 Tax=Candidatus Nitrohelix vancouverensis TaxID=2705534 RepID=A0A7T0C3T7_9BACT|nr:MAG: protein-glutamate O-methyltransferase CheR [Candidatus Nitrohelix vancouverensis]